MESLLCDVPAPGLRARLSGGLRDGFLASAPLAAVAATAHPALLAIAAAYGAFAGAAFAACSRRAGLLAGLAYGLLLWGVSAGVFGPATLTRGALPRVIAAALWPHLAYGAALGFLVGRRRRRDPATCPRWP